MLEQWQGQEFTISLLLYIYIIHTVCIEKPTTFCTHSYLDLNFTVPLSTQDIKGQFTQKFTPIITHPHVVVRISFFCGTKKKIFRRMVCSKQHWIPLTFIYECEYMMISFWVNFVFEEKLKMVTLSCGSPSVLNVFGFIASLMEKALYDDI